MPTEIELVVVKTKVKDRTSWWRKTFLGGEPGQQKEPEPEVDPEPVKESEKLSEVVGDKGLSAFQTALVQLLLGTVSMGSAVGLIAFGATPSGSQIVIYPALFSFGVAMLASFFTGSMEVRYKKTFVATGSFALFVFLVWYFKGGNLSDLASILSYSSFLS